MAFLPAVILIPVLASLWTDSPSGTEGADSDNGDSQKPPYKFEPETWGREA